MFDKRLQELEPMILELNNYNWEFVPSNKIVNPSTFVGVSKD